ncbi:hypothetical protein TRVA0_039S01068 [Trichomonascus vanleenenianus]|uniref:uncharacterized protein n=1 Tax=Trichomonascus vanleenenianus TaxID=2268995 RepID=UPI003EC9C50E
MSSWIKFTPESPFSLDNIPFGIAAGIDGVGRPVTRVGDTVVDLKALAEAGVFDGLKIDASVFGFETLNAFAALGRKAHNAVREFLQKLFTKDGEFKDLLEANDDLRRLALSELDQVKMKLPLKIGDYTDFYVGKNHAFNCGVLFRGPENALNPNYYHLPVGYHGRASSVVVSGTNIHRPCGQILPDPTAKKPVYSPCKRLDFELELAAFVSTPNKLGDPIDVNSAEDHIFGYVLMNDWSARDIQAWEYVPLGPFTAKNFGTSISAWVVLHDALAPFATVPLERPEEKRDILPYLQEKKKDSVFKLNLSVALKTADGDTAVISRGSSENMLYSFPQMLAHHTVTGCNLNTGDLIASGTISGTDSSSFGSLLEMSKGGKELVSISSNTSRKFLEDGDTVIISAIAGQAGHHVGFGTVEGKVLPAKVK